MDSKVTSQEIPLSEPQLLTWEGACSIGRRRDVLVTDEDIGAESIFQTQEDCRSANPGKSWCSLFGKAVSAHSCLIDLEKTARITIGQNAS